MKLLIEASEIKISKIVHEYIDRLYFEIINSPSETLNTLKLVMRITHPMNAEYRAYNIN